MPRKLRIQYPGAFYHITSRGNGKGKIFLHDRDQIHFLEVLDRTVIRFSWLCHSYCLMENHYHLLLETPDANLAVGMKYLNGVTAQAFNRRHQRPGHVVQGRYTSILVEKEAYLLELSRYMVLNPVRAGLVEKPEDWPWSSYRAMTGLSPPPPFLTTNFVLDHFHPDKLRAMASFRRFVRSGVEGESPLTKLRDGLYLGGDRYPEKVQQLLAANSPGKEPPPLRATSLRPALYHLLSPDIIRDRGKRNRAISVAFSRYGYPLTEIARFLGMNRCYLSQLLHGKRAQSNT